MPYARTAPRPDHQQARLSQVSTDLADDYMTLQLLAVGLAQIRLGQQEGSWRLPEAPAGLPNAWIAGMRRLAWRFLEQQQPRLPSHQDAFRWCHLPLGEWPLDLLVAEGDEDLSLIEGGQLSAFADQSASLILSKDPEAELVENRCFELLLATADRNATTEEEAQRNYVHLRSYFIEHTVVADTAMTELLRRYRAKDPQGRPWVKELFLRAYRFQPGGGTVLLNVCSDCRNLLAEGDSPCGTAGCTGRRVQDTWEALEGVYVQHRATRRFFHDPGLAELRIINQLQAELGDRLHPWWGMDAVDAAVDFTGSGEMGRGEWWAADVKDHASGALLGKNFHWDPRATAKRRFLVLPAHRFEQHRYVDDLVSEMEGRVAGVEVVSEASFVGQVLARFQECR